MHSANQLEVPLSNVFIFCDTRKTPPSPTSSIKACFVRSRPNSATFSDFEYTEFPGIGDLSSSGPSPISSGDESDATTPAFDSLAEATESWVLSQAASPNSDTHSIAASNYTTRSRMRIVRRSDADADEELTKLAREKQEIKDQDSKKPSETENADKSGGITSRRRTWPSYKAIRKTVSSILHRKEPSTATGGRVDNTNPIETFEPPIERIKPSSASLFTKRRRSTRSSTSASTPTAPRAYFSKLALPPRTPQTSVIPILQHRTQLRRSRSFSGFTNVLAVIDDDDDLDEATTEASGVVQGIRRRWAFEEIPEDSGSPVVFHMGVFERSVE